ncbi:helix-turn-helix domain-containing protein [Zeimonas arvi]|uniref:Helix-turn-helix transcriptional regulator n=1 Tax=Zeimonas arvi TaxID=2498847 RepID=A0A5C8NY78_9BURK|nr:helix-turn-helix transcriptional regulator [Zeimonas arvi]TXL66076.1 helix-turn-helix transcriptional regulator [Zeimonas arvi]
MTSIQIIEKDGQPAFAVVPIEIWERVRVLVEDLDDVATFDAALSAHDEFRIPFAVVKAEFEEGLHPVRASREHRRLTQDRLAQRARISKAYLSQIEGGKRAGSTATLRKLAGALQVPAGVLLER